MLGLVCSSYVLVGAQFYVYLHIKVSVCCSHFILIFMAKYVNILVKLWVNELPFSSSNILVKH